LKHNKNTLRNVETFLTEFEGYFAEGVSGIFKIIRGFADLRDLAEQIKVEQECLDNL
jgi:hypothetical protein